MNSKEEIMLKIKDIASAFYQNRNEEAVKAMPELVKRMADILDAMPEELKNKGCTVIGSLLEAFEQKEYVMTADILSYEVMELLNY